MTARGVLLTEAGEAARSVPQFSVASAPIPEVDAFRGVILE
jgi:hypothetical protein